MFLINKCCVGRIFIGLVDTVLTAEFTRRLIFYKNNYERRINKNIEGKDFGGIECTILKEKVTIKVKYMDKDILVSGKNCKPRPTKYQCIDTQCDLYMYFASPNFYF
jgi:hypothetical protein